MHSNRQEIYPHSLQEISSTELISPEKLKLLFMHSILNIMNVILGNLNLLQFAEYQPEATKILLDKAEKFLADIHAAVSLEEINFTDFSTELASYLQLYSKAAHLNPPSTNVQQIHAILVQVFDHFERSRERLKAYALAATNEWISLDSTTLHSEIQTFLLTIAQNSRGRYNMIFSPNDPARDEKSYLIQININTDHTPFTVPNLFMDMCHDLIANARKYTPIGGTIDFTLENSATYLRFAVSDSGRGVPSDEIGKIVNFGYRASNVTIKDSTGGGFGLTKVFYLCRSYGGRFWIGSTLGLGSSFVMEFKRH